MGRGGGEEVEEGSCTRMVRLEVADAPGVGEGARLEPMRELDEVVRVRLRGEVEVARGEVILSGSSGSSSILVRLGEEVEAVVLRPTTSSRPNRSASSTLSD